MLLTKQLLHTTDSFIKRLNATGISTVQDFVQWYPRAYEDKSKLHTIFSLMDIRDKCAVRATIETITTEKTRSHKILSKAILRDEKDYFAEAVWFNSPYFLKQYKAWDEVIVFGKPKYGYGKLQFSSPTLDFATKQGPNFMPVYREILGISSEWIAEKMSLLRDYFAEIPDLLPRDICRKKNFLPKEKRLRAIHAPENPALFERARYELAYEELFAYQYAWVLRRAEGRKLSFEHSAKIPLDVERMRFLISELPFALTGKQKVVLFQILKDMEGDFAMNRLLQGDVGTGKTAVALLASLHAMLGSPIQTAFMVPTEILAEQHFRNLAPAFEKHGMLAACLVGSMTRREKEEVKTGLANGSIRFVVGTHALISEDVIFHNLGFVVIDEQHRFGVEQRKILEQNVRYSYRVPHTIQSVLSDENSDSSVNSLPPAERLSPHVLYMTATPIPRTLAITLHGDQDVSILDEYPAGRLPILTKVVRENARHEAYNFIDAEIRSWRQVYWISPLVSESETLEDVASAINMQEILSAVFPQYKIWLLHGRMKWSEKDAIMQDFLSGKIQILSSTSVVEVGVDNRNASVIAIEAAERFGLSQLHQFRGRVGRGAYQSHCFLFTTKSYTGDRLRAMEQTNDGFELSEIDLELRWPGEIFGIRQSGLPEFRIADLRDLALVEEIRGDINEMAKKSTPL